MLITKKRKTEREGKLKFKENHETFKIRFMSVILTDRRTKQNMDSMLIHMSLESSKSISEIYLQYQTVKSHFPKSHTDRQHNLQSSYTTKEAIYNAKK